MGAFRHMLEDPATITVFRTQYNIPANVEVRSDGPTDGYVFHNGWMPFWLVTVVEVGGPVPPSPTPQGLSLGVAPLPLPTATKWLQDHYGGSSVE